MSTQTLKLNLKKNIDAAKLSATGKAVEDAATVAVVAPAAVVPATQATTTNEAPVFAVQIDGKGSRTGFTGVSFQLNDALLKAVEQVMGGQRGTIVNYALAFTLNAYIAKRKEAGIPTSVNASLPDASKDETIETRGFMGITDPDFIKAMRWATNEIAAEELAEAKKKYEAMQK